MEERQYYNHYFNTGNSRHKEFKGLAICHIASVVELKLEPASFATQFSAIFSSILFLSVYALLDHNYITLDDAIVRKLYLFAFHSWKMKLIDERFH